MFLNERDMLAVEVEERHKRRVNMGGLRGLLAFLCNNGTKIPSNII